MLKDSLLFTDHLTNKILAFYFKSADFEEHLTRCSAGKSNYRRNDEKCTGNAMKEAKAIELKPVSSFTPENVIRTYC